MNRLLIIFIFVLVYKFLLNLSSFLRIKHYEKEFLNYLANKESKIEEHRLQTIDLFKKAGIKDTLTPITQPSGYGNIASFNASVFQNFPSNMQVIAVPAMSMFRNAIGIYKSRMMECLSPLYWISLIVFLPRNILLYIGLDSESTAFKLWNVSLSFLWWLFCTIISLFQPEIKSFITNLFA